MMKTIRAVLVDDEPRGLASLQKLLQINCPQVEVVATSSSADEAMEVIGLIDPDLVFLDIAMPGKNGIAMLHEMGPQRFQVVFVSAHSNYMQQAFRFSAVDYLVKPVDEDQLIAAVARASRKIVQGEGAGHLDVLMHNMEQKEGRQKMKLCIPSVKGFSVVLIQDILYCTARGNYTFLQLAGGSSILASRPLNEYEDLLGDSQFIRVHKSHLVNLEHIKEYIRGEGGSLILSDGTEIEVSRRRKEELLGRMKEFYKF